MSSLSRHAFGDTPCLDGIMPLSSPPDFGSTRAAETCLERIMALIYRLKACVGEKILTRAFCRSVARVLLAYFKGLKRDDVADLDVPLGMLYMLEPVRTNVQLISIRFNAGYRSPMVSNSGPTVTTKREMISLKYATINYGGRPLISRIKCLGCCILSEVFWRSWKAHTHRIWLSLYFYLMDLCSALDTLHRKLQTHTPYPY